MEHLLDIPNIHSKLIKYGVPTLYCVKHFAFLFTLNLIEYYADKINNCRDVRCNRLATCNASCFDWREKEQLMKTTKV